MSSYASALTCYSESRQTFIQNECPLCDAHFVRSSVIKESRRKLSMYCGACHRHYELQRSREQDELLKKEYGYPSQIEPLQNIQQLSEGDVIAFKRSFYEHHAIVVDVDYYEGSVTVVEFEIGIPINKGCIKQKKWDFYREINSINAFVRRFMPLDCLPTNEVISLACGFAKNPKCQPKYDAFYFNCQHLSSWCKTKRLISQEADVYRKVYRFFVTGIKILSLFPNPFVKITSFAISAVDLARSIRSAYVKNGLLKSGLIDDYDEIDWFEVVSNVATVAVGIGALAFIGYKVYKHFSNDEKKERKK